MADPSDRRAPASAHSSSPSSRHVPASRLRCYPTLLRQNGYTSPHGATRRGPRRRRHAQWAWAATSYLELIDEVRPFTGARRLIDALRARGHAVVLASSAKPHEIDHYLDLLDA